MTGANAHRGHGNITLAGVDYTLVYDWEALAKIFDAYGEDAIADIQTKPMPKQVAGIIAIGLEHSHAGELSAADVMKISPPLIDAIAAVADALTKAYYGAQTLEQIQESVTEAEAAAEKKPGKKRTKNRKIR